MGWNVPSEPVLKSGSIEGVKSIKHYGKFDIQQPREIGWMISFCTVRHKRKGDWTLNKKTSHKTWRDHVGRSKPWSHWDLTAFRIQEWCDVNFCLCVKDSPLCTLINTSKKILVCRAWPLFRNVWRLVGTRSKNGCKCKHPHVRSLLEFILPLKKVIPSEDPNFSKWGCKYANWKDFGRIKLFYIRKRMGWGRSWKLGEAEEVAEREQRGSLGTGVGDPLK